MSEVKRFYQSVEYKDAAHMKEHPEGEYVLHSDYEKLQAQLEKAEKALKDINVDDSSIEGKWVNEYELRDKARQYFKEKESK